jgi:hypothetical protein
VNVLDETEDEKYVCVLSNDMIINIKSSWHVNAVQSSRRLQKTQKTLTTKLKVNEDPNTVVSLQ